MKRDTETELGLLSVLTTFEEFCLVEPLENLLCEPVLQAVLGLTMADGPSRGVGGVLPVSVTRQ